MHIKIVFFHFYFLNQDFFLTIISITLYFTDLVDNVHLEGIVSQNFDLGPSLDFIKQKRVIFYYFLQLNFLDFIK